MVTDVVHDGVRLAALIDDDPEVAGALRRAPQGDAELGAALLDALDDAGALAYMEWSDSGVELAEALGQLPRIVRAGIDVDEVGDVDGSLEDAISRADALLIPRGMRLLYLDEGTDACPLVVVAQRDVDEIVEIAGRIGLKVRAFG